MSKYKLKTIEKISARPILSIGAYVSLDAECIVAGSSDRHLRFLDKDSLYEIAKCRVDKKSVNCVSISEMSPEGDDPIIVTGGKDSSVQIWNPADGSLEKNIELPTKEVRSLAIYQGSETYLVIGTKEAKVIVWDVKCNKLIAIFEGHKASVHCVSITSSVVDLETQNDMDFLCIASGGADRTVRTWDLATKKRKKKFRHKRSIAAMVVANKGIRPLLATAGVERAIKLWDVDTGVLLRTLEGHLDQINCLSLWEGYQMLLISGSSDNTLRIYDILSGECVCVLVGHRDAVLGVTIIDNDCPKIVSCSEDLTLVQWSLQDIIGDFFCTDDDNLGSRNIVPAYLPLIAYVAPAELDKKALTKEERKKLRKEAKRAKKSGKFSDGQNQVGGDVPAGGAGRLEEEEGEEDDEHDPYREDFEEEIHEDHLHRQQQQQQQDSLARMQLHEQHPAQSAKSEGDLSEPTPTDDQAGLLRSISTGSKVSPVQQDLLEAPHHPQPDKGSVTVRKASVVVMKNIMGKVLGFGSAAVVGIEPLSPPVQEAVVVVAKRGSIADSNSGKDDEKNLRALANATQNKFNVAEVEKELQADRMRSKAAEKLAFRLNMKKLNSAQQAGTGGTSGAEEVGGLSSDETLTDAALQSIKAEKLRQHKLQEGRRHQSMLVAKERSSNALQKRLDELAAKKKLMPASFEEDEEDDSDSDKEASVPTSSGGGGGAAVVKRPKLQSMDMSANYLVTATTTADGQQIQTVVRTGGGEQSGTRLGSFLKKKIIYISDEEEEELSGDEEEN